MFKPTNIGGNKKPQAKTNRKPGFAAMHKFSSSTSAAPSEPSSEAPNQPNPKQKRGFEDWLGDDDEMDMIYDQREQKREAFKSKKRSKKNKFVEKTVSYEDHYDPSVPVPISGFATSERKYDDLAAVERNMLDRMRYLQEKRDLTMAQRSGGDRDAQRKFSPGWSIDKPDPRPTGHIPADQFRPRGIGFGPPESLASGNAHPGPSSYRNASDLDGDFDMDEAPRASFAPPQPAADIDMEETADQAYARRLALSGRPPAASAPQAFSNIPQARPAPVSFAPASAPSPVPAPASATPPAAATPTLSAADAEKKAKVAAQIAALKAKMNKPAAAPSLVAPSPVQSTPVSAPPPPANSNFAPTMNSGPTVIPQHPGYNNVANQYSTAPPQMSAPGTTTISAAPSYSPEYLAKQQGTTISAAPSYNPEYLAKQQQQQQQHENDTTQSAPEAPPEERSSRPGQMGFAERQMKKMGWEKGQGLGASGDGITTALKMQAQKRKKKSDAQGGGYVAPANMGKIVGGKKAKVEETAGGGGDLDGMSQVVKLSGMLENMDVDHEIAENDLLQEIGEEMGQYGQVERLYIWRKSSGGNEEVFVKFTSPLSAVRCLKVSH